MAQLQSCIWPHLMLACSCRTTASFSSQGLAPAAANQSGQVSGFAPAPAPLAHSWRCQCAVHRRLARPETGGLRAAQLRSWQTPGLHDVLGASSLEVDYPQPEPGADAARAACSQTRSGFARDHTICIGQRVAWLNGRAGCTSPRFEQCNMHFQVHFDITMHHPVHGTTSWFEGCYLSDSGGGGLAVALVMSH